MVRVFTVGVFDLFHVGHLRILQKAAALGDRLLVAITPDEESVTYKRLPIIPFEQRWEIVEQFSFVDEVMVDPCVYPVDFYRQHEIDIHCQGSEIPGHDYYAVARELGILRILGRDPTIDTSRIIETIIHRHALQKDHATEEE